MRAFDDAIDKMFYPEKRHGLTTIARTTGSAVGLSFRRFICRTRSKASPGRIARPITACPGFFPLSS